MLEVSNVSKNYGKKNVLYNISFTAQPGEIIGLVGENGAGKSTLLRILATLEKMNAGSITLNDVAYQQKNRKIKQQIGFVPQDISVWDDFTVEENMIFFEKLAWKNKTHEELRQLCLDMQLVKWKEKVKTLSGGMKRKLNLAISLIHDPELLLLDEPTVGIDLKSKKEIGNYLRKKLAANGKIIIHTSHDMDEIIHLCDRVICIGEDPFYSRLLTDARKKLITF